MSTTSAQAPEQAAIRSTRIGRRAAGSVLLSAAVACLLLAVPPLRGVARQVVHMQAGWVGVAVGLELASCLAFVAIFRLFFDQLPAGAARELAWAEEGSGALLPGGGVGALAIGGWLLHRAGLSTRSIIDRSSALFFLTSAVNVAALVGAGALLAAAGPAGPDDAVRVGIPIIGGLAATAAVLAIPVAMHRSSRRSRPTWLVDLASGITRARRALVRPSWRLLGGLGYLGFDIAALGATFAATGHPLPAAPLVLGYLIGYLANLVPIPGGFGVLEGGLAGTLIAYGAPPTQAAAAVVVYHAIAFWIPSLGGLAGYALLRRRLSRGDSTRDPQPDRRGAASRRPAGWLAAGPDQRGRVPSGPPPRGRGIRAQAGSMAGSLGAFAPSEQPQHGNAVAASLCCGMRRERDYEGDVAGTGHRSEPSAPGTSRHAG